MRNGRGSHSEAYVQSPETCNGSELQAPQSSTRKWTERQQAAYEMKSNGQICVEAHITSQRPSVDSGAQITTEGSSDKALSVGFRPTWEVRNYAIYKKFTKERKRST